MLRAVKISSMSLRILWLLAVILGLSIVGFNLDPQGGWGLTHMILGIIIVILFWFLGVAQGLTKMGSLILTVATFLVGLAIPIIGIVQTIPADKTAAQYLLQATHVVLIIAAIALGEICAARYKRAVAAPAA
ncbi:MAG: hypothetical protein ABI068_09990 [Ktedonobacterales bacterium]